MMAPADDVSECHSDIRHPPSAISIEDAQRQNHSRLQRLQKPELLHHEEPSRAS
jgi:hypothetical protein